jgi:hypothetical protein
MKLTGLHILLTYQCTFECDHCFVWGSPWQSGVLSLDQIKSALSQALDTGTVESIYFEGGEPFLYYSTLLESARLASGMGFQVGIVSNAYWATSEQDAQAALLPFVGLVQDLTVSSDLFHYNEKMSRQARYAQKAAERLGIPTGVISIERPEIQDGICISGQLPEGSSGVMFRGRAWEKLAPQAAQYDWRLFNRCPHEDLQEPGRVHLDPLGNLHLCQGIAIGNLFQMPLKDICSSYQAGSHPVIGPLLTGGPAELVRRYDLPHPEHVADACFLCYSARSFLRPRFSDVLGPDQIYGKF